jgi:[CysO sulfur-carrier protein]-S-L-cysteine hydrolase
VPEELREDQVQRYSRTILLRDVGGPGQQALLSTGAQLISGGPALLTAAAYLAASGTPVDGPPSTLATGDSGFLVRAAELGLPARPTLRRALERLNPDSVSSPVRRGTLLALPDGCRWPRPLVAVGRRGTRWVLWGASAEACGVCLAEAVRGAEAPDRGPEAIQAGALAALLFQRLVLGLAPPLSGLEMGREGWMEVLDAPECAHRPDVPGDVVAEAVRHLEACYPEEGCGVVLRGPAGARFVPLRNAYGGWATRDRVGFPRDARSAFVFEPAEWLALLREADARGEGVTAIVHAHPDGLAAFSAEDRAQAAPGGLPLLPGVAYLVVSVRQGRATDAVWVGWEAGEYREETFSLPR